ncbi:MAG: hypothetical protein GY842_12630 [bacterium]|nr:hypothetical protein [bacterium]
MRKRLLIGMVCALVGLCATAELLQGAGGGKQQRQSSERLVIKICNWDGVVPSQALDGFGMPAGKWVDFQKSGWEVESYAVAPNAQGDKNGFYAILKK